MAEFGFSFWEHSEVTKQRNEANNWNGSMQLNWTDMLIIAQSVSCKSACQF